MAIKTHIAAQTAKDELDARPLFVGKALPQVVLDDYNVYDAALDRIRWIFEEFDGKVVVSNSGGKDSTIVLELAAIVAAERNELPLKVYWLDQECEFQATVDYQRYIMYERPDIDFTWYQIPFELENSTNHDNHWLNVWDAEHPEVWVRPKEPGSVTENIYGQKRWNGLLDAIATTDWNGYAVLDGIRGQESPARRLVSRSKPMYKWVTWSVGGGSAPKKPNKDGRRFHPIHDWTYTDVWKAIYDNGWRYNEHYNHLYQYGIPPRSFRVSNYHHESALKSLHFLQEIEPETWEAATKRLEGINTYGQLREDQYPHELPYMFSTWDEYAQYLIDNLAPDEEHREMFNKQFRRALNEAGDVAPDGEIGRIMVKTVIGNDFYGTHINNYLVGIRSWRKQLEIEELGRRRAEKKRQRERAAMAREQES